MRTPTSVTARRANERARKRLHELRGKVSGRRIENVGLRFRGQLLAAGRGGRRGAGVPSDSGHILSCIGKLNSKHDVSGIKDCRGKSLLRSHSQDRSTPPSKRQNLPTTMLSDDNSGSDEGAGNNVQLAR
ncbi:hypothetical protein MRB53_038483 [Persea americana]|nr:hypothetical protein MRB53_038483 [Persea americana]